MENAAVVQAQQEQWNAIIDPAAETQVSRPDWVIGLDVQVVDVLSGYTVAGVLEGFTTGEVTVAVDELTPEQRTVMVQFDSFVFEGETLFCRPKGSGYEAHITIDDVEKTGRRREPRFPIRLAGQMIVPHSEPVALTIVDMSREGLGIELPIAVESGQPVAISAGSVFVFAHVRYCRHAGTLYRAGLEIQHVLEGTAVQAEEKQESSSGALRRMFGERLASTAKLLGAFDISKGWRAGRPPRWREQ
jgi:PilZ domain